MQYYTLLTFKYKVNLLNTPLSIVLRQHQPQLNIARQVKINAQLQCSMEMEIQAVQLTATQILPYKVKMQYVQISTLIETSIEHPISGQSTQKVVRIHMFHMIDTAFKAILQNVMEEEKFHCHFISSYIYVLTLVVTIF